MEKNEKSKILTQVNDWSLRVISVTGKGNIELLLTNFYPEFKADFQASVIIKFSFFGCEFYELYDTDI